MLRLYLALITSLLTAFLPALSHANEKDWQGQVEMIASQLVERLDVQEKFVVKSLSPEQTGLPEEFLRKLTNEIAASVLKASDFQVQLVNRFTTEDLWSEAIEFGDVDFQTLYEASKADSMILIEPRLSGNGVEMNVSVYGLIGDSSSTLIASSGNVKLSIDLEKDLGISLDTVDDSLSQIENKLGLVEAMLAADKDMSGNQLSKIFFEFSIPTDAAYNTIDPIDFAYLFKGCDAPIKIANEPFMNAFDEIVFPYSRFGEQAVSVFDMRCEVYDGSEMIVPKNIEKETKLPIFLILHTRAGLDSIRVEQPFSFAEGALEVPQNIEPFIHNAWCSEVNMASSGQTVYELVFPGRKKVWLMHEYSSGSGGTDASLTLASGLDDLIHLSFEPFETYRSCAMIDGTKQYSSFPAPDGTPLTTAPKGTDQPILRRPQVEAVTSSEELEDVAFELFVVANTLPPDDYLALRTEPSSKMGSRISIMPNGTKVEVLERRNDGWWRVRNIETGETGWAKSGRTGVDWIVLLE